MIEDPLTPLKHAIGRGEALLILGQDYNPATIDRVLVDAKEVFGSDQGWSSLPELYCSVGGDEAARKTLTALFQKYQPDVSMLELASMPWKSVITTAVDPVVLNAFFGVGSQRRIIELGPNQLASISPSRSGQLLHLIRAFGTPEMEQPSMTPTSPSELAQARMIRLPAVFAALPRLVGLHGHVTIEGITSRDWLDEQALKALCVVLATLPPGRVFWFGPADDQVRATLANKAHFEERPLLDQLQDWAKDEQLQRDLRQARERVFGIGERTVTLEQDGKSTKIRFTAQEWRSIARVGNLLDDLTLEELKAQKPGDKADLIRYVRRSHAGVPDWSGPARGLIFERKQVADLVQALRAFIAKRKASILNSAGEPRRARRMPFLLSGPPASGKTMGLLHAAWTLRAQYRLCVLWLLPGVAGLDVVAIERICRLLESKDVRWILLFLDSRDLEEYFRIKRRLEAAGRRILVVGAESRLLPPEPQEELPGELRRFSLEHRMIAEEGDAFRAFLTSHRIPLAAEGSRDFLRALSAAVPEVQFGAQPSLLDEYEQILKEARPAKEREQGAAATAPPPGSLAAQLRKLFPALAAQGEEQREAVSRFSSSPLLKDLLNLVLFCAQIDRPISVDLLFKVLGSKLISEYLTFARAFEDTALIQELELDQEGTLALTTGHELHARWLLRGLFPDKSAQLDLLRRLAVSIDWDPDAYPGDNPYQDFVLNVLKAVGPRGEYKELYRSYNTLDCLSQLIREVRAHFGMEQPALLALEAIILGDLALRESTEKPDIARERCRLALELLGRAEDILRGRRPSEVRNFELQRVLTLTADIRGTLINTWLRGRGAAVVPDVGDVFAELSRIEEDAIRAQSYSPTYHPLDIVFWSHRDALDYLPQEDLGPAIRIHLLETMESALEIATEEPLDPSQLGRYKDRRVQLYEKLGNRQLSADLAREMREEGDFSGELSLVRSRLREVERGGGLLATACLNELRRLYSFWPYIFKQTHAVHFLHRLWTQAFLEGRLGEGPPKLVKASSEEWRMLEDITRVRLQFAEHSELPYPLFFLAWALYQLDEPREAREVLSLLERQSLGNPRRVGELVYLSDEEGRPRVLRGKIIHARAGHVRLSVPELDSEIMDLRPEVETQIAPSGLRLGEFVEISIALNYRGALARPPEGSHGRGSRKRRP